MKFLTEKEAAIEFLKETLKEKEKEFQFLTEEYIEERMRRANFDRMYGDLLALRDEAHCLRRLIEELEKEQLYAKAPNCS